MSFGNIPPFYSLGGGGGFGITGSPSTGWTFTKTAETGVAETIATLKIGDSSSQMFFENNSPTALAFEPTIRGAQANSNRPGLTLIGSATSDSGSIPIFKFNARFSSGTTATVRPLYSFQNNDTEVAKFTAAGGLIVQGGTAPSLTLGASGTAITQVRVYSQAIDPAAVAANTTAEQTFTVTGLATTDKVFVNKPSNTAGLGIVNTRVSAVDTLAITFGNFTGAPIDAASETYTITAIRS